MEDKKRSKPETETAAEVEIEDLDVEEADTESVKAGFMHMSAGTQDAMKKIE